MWLSASVSKKSRDCEVLLSEEDSCDGEKARLGEARAASDSKR
ncbi:uncharacterized protein RAG0_14111 [Rhynchosporium agropyri]|uniref:Uncharacterized protein n=1 Tax=Rhynchosporium agropyri TaxID=914238 RepID=A0A1E1LFM4_9HELO|nr:uncharacterized protein RAG0_14111 [Rhynchosporium agropyri]